METADQTILDLSKSAGSFDDSSPFTSKQLLYVQDNNSSGNYSNNQVIFELQSLSNNGRWNDYQDAWISLPIVVQVNGTTAVDFTTGVQQLTDYCVALKNSHVSLVDSFQLDFGNSSVVQRVQNVNQYLAFKQHTELTTEDEELNGDIIGYRKDTSDSWSYQTAASTVGCGLCNNCNANSSFPANDGAGSYFNEGMLKRQTIMKRPTSISGAGHHHILGADANINDLYRNAGKDYIENTSTAKYYYKTVILRLKDLSPFFGSSDFPKLLRGSYMRLTLNINQIFFNINKANTTGVFGRPNNMLLGGSSNPLLVAADKRSLATGVDGTGNLAFTDVGCGSNNLVDNKTYEFSLSVYSTKYTHSQGAAKTHAQQPRFYIHSYTMNPVAEASYLSLGQKVVKYIEPTLFTMYSVSPSFNQIISTGSRRPKRMIIMPFLSSSSNFSEVSAFSELTSPYSSAPSTVAPLLMSNFQVLLGGMPVYAQPLNYSYDAFLHEMGMLGSLGNLIAGQTSGRISYKDWINLYGYIVVDLRRRLPEDLNTLLPISISGNVISLKTYDFYIWLEEEREVVLDIVSGQRIS